MKCPWGMSTDLQAAFDLVLSNAVKYGLSEDQMVKNIFIISDMQFNQAVSPNIITNLEAIKVKFRNHGYTCPHLVFWNVHGSSTNVAGTKDDTGISLVGGFSKDLIKMFLSGETPPSPIDLMYKTLDQERYSRMVLA